MERLVTSRRSTAIAVNSFIHALEEAPRDIQAQCPYWVVYGITLKPIAIRRKADGAKLAEVKMTGPDTVALTWSRSAGDIALVTAWTRRLSEMALGRAEENEAAAAVTASWSDLGKE